MVSPMGVSRRRTTSLFVPQLGLADPDDVSGLEPVRGVDADAVHEGPVRRAPVDEPGAVVAWLDPGVRGGRELVVLELHLVLSAAADREGDGVDRVAGALGEGRAGDDDEPAGKRRRATRGRKLLGAAVARAQDHALLGRADVLAGAADDRPDEEVEQNEEADLEGEQHPLDAHGVVDHGVSRRKTIWVEPIVTRSPSSSFAR